MGLFHFEVMFDCCNVVHTVVVVVEELGRGTDRSKGLSNFVVVVVRKTGLRS